jgi:hypothetical protein
MRARVREKIARAVVSALIGSELTARELREATDELCRYPFLNPKDAERLLDLIDGLIVDAPQKAFGDEVGRSTQEIALHHIERRRLSKREVLDLMEKSFGKPIGELVSTDLTRNEMISRFFGIATSSSIQRFLALIAPTSKDDPYLQGIMKRSG